MFDAGIISFERRCARTGRRPSRATERGRPTACGRRPARRRCGPVRREAPGETVTTPPASGVAGCVAGAVFAPQAASATSRARTTRGRRPTRRQRRRSASASRSRDARDHPSSRHGRPTSTASSALSASSNSAASTLAAPGWPAMRRVDVGAVPPEAHLLFALPVVELHGDRPAPAPRGPSSPSASAHDCARRFESFVRNVSTFDASTSLADGPGLAPLVGRVLARALHLLEGDRLGAARHLDRSSC